MTQPQPQSPLTPQPLSPADERLWATLIHVGGIVLGFIPALVGYLVLKDRSAFVGENARNALNFQITLALASVVITVLTIITFGLLGILFLAVGIVALIFSILGAVAANRGEIYRYPLTIPFIK